jgi:transcriptional regulator with XRE-family HTH domain
MSLGKRIKSIREERDWTQNVLCARVNRMLPADVKPLSQQALAGLENRDSTTSSHATWIADALGVSVRWLMDGLGDKSATDWPFPDLELHRFLALTPNQRIEIQGLVRARIKEFEAENAANAKAA